MACWTLVRMSLPSVWSLLCLQSAMRWPTVLRGSWWSVSHCCFYVILSLFTMCVEWSWPLAEWLSITRCVTVCGWVGRCGCVWGRESTIQYLCSTSWIQSDPLLLIFFPIAQVWLQQSQEESWVSLTHHQARTSFWCVWHAHELSGIQHGSTYFTFTTQNHLALWFLFLWSQPCSIILYAF